MPDHDELRAAVLAGELSIAACQAAAKGEHKDWKFKDELLKETIECIRDLYESNKQHEASFDLRWKADQRAIKRWQEAHPGKENVWPDHADLCIWLMERFDRPPLTRERVAAAVGELFQCGFTTAEKLVPQMEGAGAPDLSTWAWNQMTMTDRLCRLLGVLEE